MDIGPAYPCAPDAEPAKSGSPTGSALPAPALEDSLTRLIAALSAQTSAMGKLSATMLEHQREIWNLVKSISHLAQTNSALVQAMAEADGMDDMQPESYMDGSKVR